MFKRTLLLGAMAAGWLLTPALGQAQFVANDARLLASGCFQCHGTNGRGPGFERLAGESADEIYDELREMRAEGARERLRSLFDEVFEHRAFTGRSGTMFGFEGLGCIYCPRLD